MPRENDFIIEIFKVFQNKSAHQQKCYVFLSEVFLLRCLYLFLLFCSLYPQRDGWDKKRLSTALSKSRGARLGCRNSRALNVRILWHCTPQGSRKLTMRKRLIWRGALRTVKYLCVLPNEMKMVFSWTDGNSPSHKCQWLFPCSPLFSGHQ